MLYLSIIFLLIICVYVFDVLGTKNYKWDCFNFFLVVFVLISAFAYNVGSDDLTYRESFNNLKLKNFFVDLLAPIVDGDSTRMPGWVLLNYGMKFTLDDFFFVKLIQAAFLNICVFLFIRKEAKFPFATLLLYCVINSLLVNFNTLRQSFAIGFFLLAYLQYAKGYTLRYYLLVFCAYLFHNTALILLLVPLLSYIKFNRKNVIIMLIAYVVILIAFFRSAYFADFLDELMYMQSDSMSSLMDYYINNANKGLMASTGLSIISFFLLVFDIIIIRLVFMSDESERLRPFVIFYLAVFILQQFFPIMMRFRIYFDMFLFVAISNGLYYYHKTQKSLVLKLALIYISLIICIYPEMSRSYFHKSYSTGKLYIYQYYPYTSIFSDEKYKR